MKLRSFKQYAEDRDEQDVGPEPMQTGLPGETQSDPDKPNKSADLIRALEDIIEMAKKALEMRSKGLGDLDGNGKPTDEDDNAGDKNLGSTMARPKADTGEGMFGAED